MQRSATREEIRLAYRRLAREHHPDARGDASAVGMAQINEAWRVLSDPGRRAMYDANSRDNSAARAQSAASGSAAAARNASTVRSPYRTAAPTHVAAATPSRFPWRFMLVIAAAGIGFVLVNAALTKPGGPEVPDNLIDAGSCVDIVANGDAVEVACTGANDGVVRSLITIDGVCPQDTESHRDHQGMGQVCVRLADASG